MPEPGPQTRGASPSQPHARGRGMRRREEAEARTDVTILGAGIIGICTALAAQERGLTVTIVDREPPGEMTSYGNAGVISPWSIVPLCMPGIWKSVPGWLLDPLGPVKVRWRDMASIAPWALAFLRNGTHERVARISETMDQLMQNNVDVYRRYLNGTGQEHLLADSSYVNVFRKGQLPSLDDLGWRLRIERGAPVEIVAGGDLRDLEPALSHDFESAIVVGGQARARAPGKLCQALAERVVRQGGRLVTASVHGVRPGDDGQTLLETDTGSIAAKRLVLCGGIWTKQLLEPLGIKLPVMAERGYHLEFGDPGVVVNNSIQDVAAKIVVSSMLGGVRVAGTAEFAAIDAPANYARAHALAPLTKQLLPGLNVEPSRKWMGIRPSFPDNLPAIGKVSDALPGVIVAFGHSHFGLGMAPATGRIVADMLVGTAANLELEMTRPDRFSRAA